MTLRPLRDQVIVRREAPPAMAGTLHLPEAHQDWRGQYGRVEAVGPKVRTVVVGDRVLLPLYAGVEYRHEGDLIAMMPEDDILGVVPQAN